MRVILFGIIGLFLFGSESFSQQVENNIQDTDLFLLPQELKIGEKCYIFSTLDRNGIQKYEGEIKGVLENALGPHHDLIMAEIFGDPFKDGSIYSGQSGSPVLVERDGKWYKIGTTSYSDWFLKKALAYLTPIHDVLSSKNDSSRSLLSHPSGSRLKLPQTLTGSKFMNNDYGNLVRPLFNDLKVEPGMFVGFAEGEKTELLSDDSSFSEIHAGEVLGVQLMWGDVEYTAYGTVSHRKGKEIYLFGHPFLQLGLCEYRLIRAEVIDCQPSYMSSYLIPRSTNKVLGVITQDRVSGIYGILGKKPQNSISVKIKIIASNGIQKEINFFVTQDAWLTPKLLNYAIFQSIVSYMRYWGSITIFQTSKVVAMFNENKIDTIFNSKAYISSNGIPEEIYSDISGYFNSLLNSPSESVKIKNIEYTFKAFDERREKQITKSYFADDKPYFVQEENTDLKIILTEPQKELQEITFSFKVPKDARNGAGKIIIGSASSTQKIERSPQPSLVYRFQNDRRADAIYVYIIYPPFWEKRSPSSHRLPKRSKELITKVEEYELPVNDFLIKGETEISFRIGKNDDGENGHK